MSLDIANKWTYLVENSVGHYLGRLASVYMVKLDNGDLGIGRL